MKNARYDPVDMAMSLRGSNTETTRESPTEGPAPRGASAPSDSAESASKTVPRRSSKVQMNLNVEPSTKRLLRELWKPVAAEHTQGEIIDLLVARWGSDAVAQLLGDDPPSS